jgi:2-keto-4-pentenoate hydratase
MFATEAARIVMDAFASRELIGLLSAADPTLDEAGAYAIAREIHERRVGRGEHPVGRKIGWTNRRSGRGSTSGRRSGDTCTTPPCSTRPMVTRG